MSIATFSGKGHDSQRPQGPTPGNDAGRAPLSTRIGQALRMVFTPTKGEWFGPQAPIAPQAPDAVVGRQFDYQVGQNIQIEPRQYEAFGFAALRDLSNLDIVRALIEKRKDQLSTLDWQIRPKVRPGEETRRQNDGSKDDPRIAKLEAFFQEPSPMMSFDQWMRMIIEDLLVLDAPTAYLRRNRAGGLYSVDPIDGATITPKIGQDGRPPLPPIPCYQQVLKGQPAVDYTAEELIYMPWHPRTFRVYGQSPVEQIALTINMAMRRGISQLLYFTAGTVPDGFITAPDGWTTTEMQEYQDWLDSTLAGNLEKRRQVQVVAHGSEFKEWHQAPLKDEFDEYLQRIAAFAFSYPPTPFVKSNNRATAESQQDQAIDEGREPLKKYFKAFVDMTIRKGHGITDLEFIWVDKREIDPVKQSQIDMSDINTGVRTRAEVRNDRGLDPLEGTEILTVTTGQGIFPVPSISDLSDAQLVQSAVNGSNVLVNGKQQRGSGTKTPPDKAGKKTPAKKATPRAPKSAPAQKAASGEGDPDDDTTRLAKGTTKTLYIMRRLRNTDEFSAWARAAGFESVVSDPHVTVAFSKTALDWDMIGDSFEDVTASGPMSLDRFGDAIVLRFECPQLEDRWQQICDCGASWDFESYDPHVTITFEPHQNLDIDSIEPFAGNLVFDYEVKSEVDPNWKDRVQEN